MSQQVRVSRNLEFYGDAAQESNVLGYFDLDKVCKTYEFTELLMNATNDYTPELDTTSTIAVGSGGALFTTTTGDTKVASLALGGILWLPAKNPVVEMVFKIDVITNVAIYAGFSDAVTEGSAKLPFSLITATLSDWASNAAGFLFDTRQSLSYFNIVNTYGDSEAFTQLASTFVPVANTNLTLRVAIDSAGGARYFWNGTEVGYKALAVTATTALVPFFGIRNNSGVAHVATLRRVRVWCDV